MCHLHLLTSNNTCVPAHSSRSQKFQQRALGSWLREALTRPTRRAPQAALCLWKAGAVNHFQAHLGCCEKPVPSVLRRRSPQLAWQPPSSAICFYSCLIGLPVYPSILIAAKPLQTSGLSYFLFQKTKSPAHKGSCNKVRPPG